MDNYKELMNVLNVLKTIPITCDYWAGMQACMNSIAIVANAIKGEANGITDKADA